MERLFFAVMIILIAYITYRNIALMTRYRHNKEYIECYKDMLAEAEGSYDRVCRYIENEKSEEYRNKARILQIYQQMDRDEDMSPTLEALDLKAIYYRNGKYAPQQLKLNSDVFVWFYLDMAKARRLSKFDVLNAMMDRFNELQGMENRIEYQLTKAIYNALCEKEDAGVEFLTMLLEGGYSKYDYEKNLIGLYKRFASSTLAYSGEPMDEFYKNDLHAFAGTQIGRVYMSDLEIYDKYPPKSEESETEKPLEENEEEKEKK